MIIRFLSLFLFNILISTPALACSCLKDCFNICYYGYPKVDSPTLRQHGPAVYFGPNHFAKAPATQSAADKAAVKPTAATPLLAATRAAANVKAGQPQTPAAAPQKSFIVLYTA